LPQRPFSICPATGCNTLTRGGRCALHRAEIHQRDRARRGTAAQRGYGPRWAMYSRTYRQEHPHCVACGALSECVDHITPIAGPGDPLFWDTTNHQALCHSCHSSKTTTEDHLGIGRLNAQHTKGRDHQVPPKGTDNTVWYSDPVQVRGKPDRKPRPFTIL
jgi:5-methylcytosine-specific restriction protein A